MGAIDYRQYKNLISASEVVDIAMTNSNMDSSIIDDNIILLSEITHLKEHLGGYFWGELRRLSNTTTIPNPSASEQVLLDNYIKPCLALFVKYEVLNDMQYNTTSIGIVTNDDEWSDSVGDSSLGTLRDDTYRKASILLRDMIDWISLSDNSSSFPNYTNSSNSTNSKGDNVTRLGGFLTY